MTEATWRSEVTVQDRAPTTVDEFFRERWPGAVRLATGLTSDRALAEEIAQEALVEVARRWDRLDNPPAYLRVAIVNRCRNHYRRRGVRRRAVLPTPPLVVEAPHLDEMWGLLAGLPPRRRAALVLRYYEDLSVNEIAELLDCRPGTVSSLLHRGIADLRKVLDHDA